MGAILEMSKDFDFINRVKIRTKVSKEVGSNDNA